MIIHVVRRGDSIYSISQQYGVPMDKIISDNELKNPENLVIGQTIVVMNGTVRHTVTRGQSLYSIARRYGVTVNDILEANPQITNPSRISVGQVILIPPKSQKLGSMLVNGYAIGDISDNVLTKTLPYLTYFSIFSYQVRPDGSLSNMYEEPLINKAREQKVASLMVVTNIVEGKGFSSELARTILSSEDIQNTLLNNIVATLQEKNYYGLDIDFEYVYPSDREKYNAFLRKAVAKLRPLGYTVSTAVAPKISATQQGTLYEAHDYPVHGATVDHVIIMTYEWGYTYGPPMAVSPINEVRKVLNYAVTVIPRQKILMGMPNYGYDWTLPFVKGTAARSITNTEAVELAAKVGAVIQYDYTAQAPYFHYYDSQGRRHVVWFEDARSIDAKLRLVKEYGLGGVSYWTINSYFPQNWLVQQSLYDVTKVLQ